MPVAPAAAPTPRRIVPTVTRVDARSYASWAVENEVPGAAFSTLLLSCRPSARNVAPTASAAPPPPARIQPAALPLPSSVALADVAATGADVVVGVVCAASAAS